MPETGPRVRVNQLGYLPDGPKRATLVSEAPDPVPWRLLDATGNPVATGTSTWRGFDPSAGLTVHTIDFGDVTATGDGFRLAADGDESYPFALRGDLYHRLFRDALGYFHLQRSGVEITVPGYARPAGHVSRFGGPDRNQGDLGVPCLPNEGVVDHRGRPQPGGFEHYGAAGWECPPGYALDLTGGWYDAGDHGKYVVNSGITVYQLLSIQERGSYGVLPELLAEVRWNLDWMLKMQVADGTRMRIDGAWLDAGGLVHHKVHDVTWTPMDTLPHEDPAPRYVHRPSTAATLNLAAVAAQGARLYRAVDPAYASALLAAARRAWQAAGAHPEIYAPNTNRLRPSPGGGPYADTSLADEFYWAAAQLFLTTGEDEYLAAVLASPYHVGGAEADIWRPIGFDWSYTAALGRLDLARIPSALPDRAEVVASVVAGADRYLATQAGQPFGHPYGPERYDWGSTHQVVNNAIVIATAYDLTGDSRYRTGALEAIDYVLGRNALNNSYVVGYGQRCSRHLHSRWYGVSDRRPPVPDGTLASGPNSSLQDPLAQKHCRDAAPQACYLDHPDSWSTNETAINWNAALTWYAAWAAAGGARDGAPGRRW